MNRIIIFVLLLLAGARAVSAQLSTATILGQVLDNSGAVVPNANLTLRNTDTGQTRTAVSSGDGTYQFDAVPVGNYEVQAERTGFRTAIHSGLTLTVAQQAVVNMTLQVGESSQSVTVTGEAAMINTTSGTVGGLVDEQTITDLPLNGRNYNDLTLLQPGVSQAKNVNTALSYEIGTNYSSNGAPYRSNNYLLDGAILQGFSGINASSATGTTLGVDGIREYRVITNSFTAEYGMTMGSQMVLVSRSGTNQFHGNGFEYLRNSALDARNYFDAAPSQIGHRLPEFRRNNYGGSGGGPIRKDKTFFFATYEALVQAIGTTNLSTTIPAACRGAAGTVLWNGLGTQPSGSAGPCTALGANPSGQNTNTVKINATSAQFLTQYPLPNVPGSLTGLNFPFTSPQKEHYGQMRVDQILSGKDSIFVRYTIDNADTSIPAPMPQWGTTYYSRNQFVTISEAHTFSANLLNTARFSFSRTNLETTPLDTLSSQTQFAFVPGAGTGELDVGGVSNWGNTLSGGGYGRQNVFTVGDDLFYIHGRHSLQFGAIFNRFQQPFKNAGRSSGQQVFSGLAGFLAGGASTINIVAPGSITRRDYRYNVMGFYAQDSFRLTQKLTLTMGMRYEPTSSYTEANGYGLGLRNQSDPALTPGPPFNNPSLRNWSPRFGFAWDVTGDGRTSVRGGFVLLYDTDGYGTLLYNAVSNTPPLSKSLVINESTFTVPAPLGLGTVSTSTAYRGPGWNINQPHMMQYNLTVERQLPWATAVSLAYVGSRGINLLSYQEHNPFIPNGIPVNGVCQPRPAGQAINLTSLIDGSATACWGTTATNPGFSWPTLVRPNTNFGTIGEQFGSSSSNYNGLEVTVTRRVRNGLQINGAYTYSRLLDYSQGQVGGDINQGTVAQQDPYTLRNAYGPADFDVTHNGRISAIYYFPQTKALGSVADKLVNGWWTSGILSLQTGYPFTLYMTSDRSNSGVVSGTSQLPIRPDELSGRNNSNITSGVSMGCTGVAAGTPLGTPALYYDPCAFTVQPAGFLGSEPRNSLRGPGFSNLDFSLVKDTAVGFLGEGGKVQFRVETFNLLNHANFGMPGTYVFPGTASLTPNGTAALITKTSNNSRQIQFAAKIIF